MIRFPHYLWIKGRRLYLFDVFKDFSTAFRKAKYYQKTSKCNYFILTVPGYYTDYKLYGLYMNKVGILK